MKDFFQANPPEEKGITFYYIADSTGNGKDIEIHWNCLIVNAIMNKIELYDPSASGYNFEHEKLKYTIDAVINVSPYFSSFDIITLNFSTPQQTVCNSEYPGVDIFCQSWVMFFSAIYIADKIEEFATIDFSKWQTIPLKMWMICMLTRYDDKLQVRNYGIDIDNFFNYSILHTYKGDVPTYILAKLPEIIDCGKNQPVVYSIIKNFSDPSSTSYVESRKERSSYVTVELKDYFMTDLDGDRKIPLHKLENRSFLEEVKRLTIVSETLETFPNPNCDTIQTLNCNNCTSLRSIPVIPNLSYLECKNCISLTSIPKIDTLVTIDCTDCVNLQNIPIIDNLVVLHCKNVPKNVIKKVKKDMSSVIIVI